MPSLVDGNREGFSLLHNHLCRTQAKKAGLVRDDEDRSGPVSVAALQSKLTKAARSLEKQRQEAAAAKNWAQVLEHKCASLGVIFPHASTRKVCDVCEWSALRLATCTKLSLNLH